MAIKFTDTAKLAKEEGTKILVYGRAGIGKTVLCSTAPNPIIISHEPGVKSIRNFKIPVYKVSSLRDIREVQKILVQSDEGKKYDTICIDSLSDIAEVVLSQEKSAVKDIRQAYGSLVDEVISLIRLFRDIKNKNVYFTCQEEDVEKEGVTFFRPAMPGKRLGSKLSYMFDEFFRYERILGKDGKKKRRLRTAEAFNCECKDRSGCLQNLEQPNLAAIFEKIAKGNKIEKE